VNLKEPSAPLCGVPDELVVEGEPIQLFVIDGEAVLQSQLREFRIPGSLEA